MLKFKRVRSKADNGCITNNDVSLRKRAITQDSYFRSLYRYEPHGSSENLSTRSASPPNSNGRPRSMPPSYHVSIENLNEQFWKSVELAERKIGPKKKATETQPKDPKEKVKTSTIEEVECPAPDVVRLPVPSLTHPKPQLDHHLRINGDKRNGFRPQKDQRPRSLSDINYKSQTHKIVFGDSTDGRSRPLSWSPIQFPTVTYGPGSRPSSVASGDSMGSPTGKLSPYIQRSTPKSDGFSDSSASIYLSDTWSESSDSDSVQSHTEEKNIAISAEQRLNDDSNPSQTPRKYTGNPLANVTYWVVEARNSVEVHKGYRETELDRVSPSRHRPAKVTHTQNWNGQTSRSPNAPMVSVHTDVSTL